MRRRLLVFCVGFLAVMRSVAMAQTPPQTNPGLIERDVERQRRQIEQQQQTPKQTGPSVVGPQRPSPVVVPGGGQTFLLRAVHFDKSKFISEEELKAVAAKYVGRKVDIAALQGLVADVNAIYAARGIVTAIATLPPQTANRGIVKVKLTEGRLQKSSVIGNKQTSESYIRQRVDEPKGEVLEVPRLNKNIVWFNRTNDVQVRALLQPGTDFGLTDLQLAVTEPPVNTLQLFFDNQGVYTTGRYQAGLYYKRHGLAGIDDRLTFYGIKARGNLNGNVAYNFPFNPWGGRLGFSYTQGRIRTVEGPFVSLDVTGRSNLAAVNIAQPVVALSDWLVLINGAYAYGNSESDFSSVPVTNDRFSKITGGVSVTASSDRYALTVSPAINGINWHDKLLGGERSFTTFTGLLNGALNLPAQFSVSVLGSWQYTNEKLIPGDQLFSIGGSTTVRGYPSNAVAGDGGYYANIELHRNMSDIVKGLDVFVFQDTGAVFSVTPARTQLDASGVGLSWTPLAPITLEASVGVPWRKLIADQHDYEFYGRVTFRPLSLL